MTQPRPPLPAHLVPTVEWQVAGACNYDCSYCIQSVRHRRGRPERAKMLAALGCFQQLAGQWELKCSGGEAFAHPLFMTLIVPGLVRATRHRVSVLTNFSADHRTLHRFAALTQGRLSVFSASLHLEHTTVEDFAAKAAWFVDLLDDEARFVVNQVVLPGREAEAARCRDVLASHGLSWFPQLFKQHGRVVDYPDETALRALIGQRPGPRQANLAPSYQGRACWAGAAYFVVDKNGDAWSCRTAKRTAEGHLGNIFEGKLRLAPGPQACAWEVCPCTVPANRGMIAGIGRSP